MLNRMITNWVFGGFVGLGQGFPGNAVCVQQGFLLGIIITVVYRTNFATIVKAAFFRF